MRRQSVGVRTPPLSKLPVTARKALSVAVQAADLIGESPVLSAREQALYWVNVFVRYLWNAHYDGWRITRYAPDGRVDGWVRMPVQHVTSLTFGGADLRTLFVTSASLRITPEARERQPLAGHVFAFEPGAAGLPEPLFAG